MTEYKLVHMEGHNCLDDSLASIALTWDRDYILMFSKAWGFTYVRPKKEDGLLGNRVDAGVYKNWDCIAQYYGMNATWYNKESPEEQLKKIKDNKNNSHSAIIISLDGFYVPWTVVYKKFHRQHMCIAFDIDQDEKAVKCYDPFWNMKINHLPIDHFIKGRGQCTVITRTDAKPELNYVAIIGDIVRHILEPVNAENIFSFMRSFANDVECRMNISNEFKGCEERPFIAPLIIQLTEIGSRRISFSKVLEYLSVKVNLAELSEYSCQIRKSASDWRKIRKLIVGTIGSENPEGHLHKAANEIRDVAGLEEKTAYCLENIYKRFEQ